MRHALFVIFKKAEKFEIVVCCKLWMELYGLTFVLGAQKNHLIEMVLLSTLNIC